MTDESVKPEVFKTFVSDEPLDAQVLADASGPADELDTAFAGLMPETAGMAPEVDDGEDGPKGEPDAATGPTMEPKPKRKRRTKAEIAADEAREAEQEAALAADQAVIAARAPTLPTSVPVIGNTSAYSERTRLEMEAGRRALRYAPKTTPVVEPSPNIIIPRDPMNQVPKFNK